MQVFPGALDSSFKASQGTQLPLGVLQETSRVSKAVVDSSLCPKDILESHDTGNGQRQRREPLTVTVLLGPDEAWLRLQKCQLGLNPSLVLVRDVNLGKKVNLSKCHARFFFWKMESVMKGCLSARL